MSSSFKTKLNGLINDFSMNKKIKPSCNKTDNNSSISNIILTNFKEISTPKSSKSNYYVLYYIIILLRAGNI